MREVYVKFNQGTHVQDFVRTLNVLNGDFEFVSDFRLMDARSIMGIFSLDLTQPVLLRIYDDNSETMSALKSFIIDN